MDGVARDVKETEAWFIFKQLKIHLSEGQDHEIAIPMEPFYDSKWWLWMIPNYAVKTATANGLYACVVYNESWIHQRALHGWLY